jgi:hypothetical protein
LGREIVVDYVSPDFDSSSIVVRVGHPNEVTSGIFGIAKELPTLAARLELGLVIT